MSMTRNGGKPIVRDTNYSPPQGPRKDGPMHVEPGFGTEGEFLNEMPGQEFTGSPGIGGTNHGNSGTQGRH